ncbi:MAG: hypothetical protein IPH51_18490 [Rubrivivax sp.]|nr:hypothetical protein [Rubrivivax sp.]
MVLHTWHHVAAQDRALSQANLWARRRANIREHLCAFTAQDCVQLNDHGAAVPHPRPHCRRGLALAAGLQVFCTPGFNALKFCLTDEARPSWYTAVPTMHQAIIARRQNLDVNGYPLALHAK